MKLSAEKKRQLITVHNLLKMIKQISVLLILPTLIDSIMISRFCLFF